MVSRFALLRRQSVTLSSFATIATLLCDILLPGAFLSQSADVGSASVASLSAASPCLHVSLDRGRPAVQRTWQLPLLRYVTRC